MKCIKCDCMYKLNLHGFCETCESKVIARTDNFTVFKPSNGDNYFTPEELSKIFENNEK